MLRAMTAPPVVVAPDIDVDGGLFGRRSVLGGLLVLLVITFFSTGLTVIDDLVRKADGFVVGQAVAVSPTVEITPAEGWVKDDDETIAGTALVARKNGWEIKVSTGVGALDGVRIEDAAEVFRGAEDPATQVTDLATFTTTGGVAGVTWETHGPTTASATWLIPEGDGRAVLILADGSASNLDSVEDDLTGMAESITFDGGGQ